MRDDHAVAVRLPRNFTRCGRDDFDRRRRREDRFVFRATEVAAVLVRVGTRAFRHRRGLVIARRLMRARVLARMDQLAVLIADFVRNHGEMQGRAELAAGDGPRQQRSEQTQQ